VYKESDEEMEGEEEEVVVKKVAKVVEKK